MTVIILMGVWHLPSGDIKLHCQICFANRGIKCTVNLPVGFKMICIMLLLPNMNFFSTTFVARCIRTPCRQPPTTPQIMEIIFSWALFSPIWGLGMHFFHDQKYWFDGVGDQNQHEKLYILYCKFHVCTLAVWAQRCLPMNSRGEPGTPFKIQTMRGYLKKKC